MPPNTAEQDAATDLLIAQLVAADFDGPVFDPLPPLPDLQVDDLSTDDNDEEENEEEDEDDLSLASDDNDEDDEDDLSLAPDDKSEDLDRSPIGSSGQMTAPIGSSGEGNSRLQQDEAVWWTPRGNGKGPMDEVAEGDDGNWQEDDEEEEDDGEDEAGFEWDEDDYDDLARGGVIWIPSPGEQQVGRHDSSARITHEICGTPVAEIIVGDDETLEGILAAMVL